MKKTIKYIVVFCLVFIIGVLTSSAQDKSNPIIYTIRLKKSTNSGKTYKIYYGDEHVGTFKGIAVGRTTKYSEKWIVAPYDGSGKFYLKVTDGKNELIGKVIVNATKGYSYYIEFDASAGYGINPLRLLKTKEGHRRFADAGKGDIDIVDKEIEKIVWNDKDKIPDDYQIADNSTSETLSRSVVDDEDKTENAQNRNTDKLPESNPSDVDINIPVSKDIYTKRYALIIGNEDYTTFNKGLNKEVNVDYAQKDAEVFAEYCKKVFGIPAKQIKLMINATAGQMSQGLEWISYMAEIEDGTAELIFYYSGHGLPDESTKKPYLIPVDVTGTNLKYALGLEKVFTELNKNPSKRITVFLDACFSGGGRNQGLVAMKAIKIKPKEEQVSGKMVVFSSSSGEEASSIYKEKQHGCYTYFLLKKLQETEGQASYSEIADYVKYNVQKQAATIGKKQTPQVKCSTEIQNTWGFWKFY